MQLQRMTTSIALAVALSLGLSTVAQAQPHHRDDRHGPAQRAHGPKHGHGHGHDDHRWRPGPPPRQHMGPQHRPPPPPRAYGYYRGAGPQHQWVQGSRIPPQYRGGRYVVHDWRGHRLHQPPRGYQWVRYGSDYMLVAIASGVIAQLIIHGM